MKVLARLRELTRPLALDLTKDGIPKHPLYVGYDHEPFDFSEPLTVSPSEPKP